MEVPISPKIWVCRLDLDGSWYGAMVASAAGQARQAPSIVTGAKGGRRQLKVENISTQKISTRKVSTQKISTQKVSTQKISTEKRW